jgi:hypothetical protein
MTRRSSFALAFAFWLPAMAADMLEYVIELKSDPARASREQIIEEQRKVREELAQLEIAVLASTVTTTNTLIVRMPEDLLAKAQAIPGVKRVRRTRTFRRR